MDAPQINGTDDEAQGHRGIENPLAALNPCTADAGQNEKGPAEHLSEFDGHQQKAGTNGCGSDSWGQQRKPSASGVGSSSSSTTGTKVRLVECGPLAGSPPWALGFSTPQGKAIDSHLVWARTPTGQFVRVRSTTAILPNRERDRMRVENGLGLPEFGDTTTEIYAVQSGLLPVALGYDRIVYGDHGPYVELAAHHICWSSFPNFVERPSSCFFDECWTADGMTMLYAQKRVVANKPNPPCGPWSVQNNRSEGYANYLVGKFYVACEVGTIAVSCTRSARRRRRRAGAKAGPKGQPNNMYMNSRIPDAFDKNTCEDDAGERDKTSETIEGAPEVEKTMEAEEAWGDGSWRCNDSEWQAASLTSSAGLPKSWHDDAWDENYQEEGAWDDAAYWDGWQEDRWEDDWWDDDWWEDDWWESGYSDSWWRTSSSAWWDDSGWEAEGDWAQQARWTPKEKRLSDDKCEDCPGSQTITEAQEQASDPADSRRSNEPHGETIDNACSPSPEAGILQGQATSCLNSHEHVVNKSCDPSVGANPSKGSSGDGLVEHDSTSCAVEAATGKYEHVDGLRSEAEPVAQTESVHATEGGA